MEDNEVVLLGHWASPFVMRVRIALAIKGIKYELKQENLIPMVLELNPVHKKIPILIHNGIPISESLIILEYIEDVLKDKSPLLSSDPDQRAKARFWAEYINNKAYEETGKKVWMSEGEEQVKAKEGFIEVLKVLQQELGEKPYFGGEEMGFVDVALVPFYSWFYVFEMFGNFSVEAETPKMVEWGKRCMENEVVAQILPQPEKLYEFILQLKRRS